MHIMFYLQDEIDKYPELLKLGLLFEVEVDTATVREHPTFLAFQHKSLQDFSAAFHVKSRLEEALDIKVIIILFLIFGSHFQYLE